MTKAEKYLELLKIEDVEIQRSVIDETRGIELHIFKLSDVLESYKDHCIASITDEMIDKIVHDTINFQETINVRFKDGGGKIELPNIEVVVGVDDMVSFGLGAKWLRDKLLNKY